MLAYGSLLNEGFNVRISGQDVEKVFFSQTHILKVEDSEEEICLLNNIDKIKEFLVFIILICQNMELGL